MLSNPMSTVLSNLEPFYSFGLWFLSGICIAGLVALACEIFFKK